MANVKVVKKLNYTQDVNKSSQELLTCKNTKHSKENRYLGWMGTGFQR